MRSSVGPYSSPPFPAILQYWRLSISMENRACCTSLQTQRRFLRPSYVPSHFTIIYYWQNNGKNNKRLSAKTFVRFQLNFKQAIWISSQELHSRPLDVNHPEMAR
eukprot:Lithocolla_globosa_v1_NODE_969_length_3008_cov_31.801219.p4 type:complete len:105 gc:universal NODE_969_length_3008_cov_31.801219:1421-1735(+)